MHIVVPASVKHDNSQDPYYDKGHIPQDSPQHSTVIYHPPVAGKQTQENAAHSQDNDRSLQYAVILAGKLSVFHQITPIILIFWIQL